MRLDIRFVVTSLKAGSAEHIYDTLYCARGQAENLIKLHKAQLKSDRTSCRSANFSEVLASLRVSPSFLITVLVHARASSAQPRLRMTKSSA